MYKNTKAVLSTGHRNSAMMRNTEQTNKVLLNRHVRMNELSKNKYFHFKATGVVTLPVSGSLKALKAYVSSSMAFSVLGFPAF